MEGNMETTIMGVEYIRGPLGLRVEPGSGCRV